MKDIVAKKDFILNGKQYITGDKIEIKDINVINALNEKGFIEPLSYKDLVIIGREIQKEENKL